ncbi:hypothetical protein SmJEL517_g05700 [Synchytrium microbalum]|uniref:Uncharacterized protein n=1 Tax=Synchytrium microbalum TaxID=1806994 RepID=A0A507BMK5_9FUNG|nr:uncharacterized protein SmJEL517_g05700 [Synchytrium microbalum]TPX30837.1 hypothetical protein SmJEL517_g05700 [Synchytrium microbalum]
MLGRKPTKQKKAHYTPSTTRKDDIYEADDNAKDETKIIGSASNGRLDDVETYELDDDAVIADEDDEEIDESDAFDEDDEVKYGEFFTAKTSSDKTKKTATTTRTTYANGKTSSAGYKPLDLNEDSDADEPEDDQDDEEEYSDGSDMMDLSELLNDKPTINKRNSTTSNPIQELLLPEDDDASDIEDDDEDISAMSDDDEEEEASADEDANINMMDLVSSLTPAKCQLVDQDATSTRKRRHRTAVITETFPESEFNLRNKKSSDRNNSNSNSNGIELADLLAPLKDTTEFSALKKSISSFESDSKYSQPFAAPLPKRLQDKQTRQAAYGAAKKEVSKWSSTVLANQLADTLSFPLNESSSAVLTSNALSAKFEPGNEFEKEVFGILEASDMTERKMGEFEELAMQKVSMDEVIKRREELSKMRSLLFFHEQKQKKIAKIKSKTYRKIRKKESLARSAAAQESLSVQDLMKLDPELARQKVAEQELARIQERMSLRHKNSGKWAKSMIGRRDADPETRQALMDQLQQHDALKRKMSGLDSDESSSDDEDDIEANKILDDESHDTSLRKSAITSLNHLSQEINNEAPKKGVYGMKFMQKAFAKQQEEAVRDVQDAVEEMELEEEVRRAEVEGRDVDELLLKRKSSREKKDEESKKSSSGRVIYGADLPGRGKKRLDERIEEDSSDSDDEDGHGKPGMKLGRGGLALKASMSSGFSSRVSGSISIPMPQRLNSNVEQVPALKPIFQVEAFTDDAPVQSIPPPPTKSRSASPPQAKQPDLDDLITIDKLPSVVSHKIQHQPTFTEKQPQQNPWLASSSTVPLQKSLKISHTPQSKTDKALTKLSVARKDIKSKGGAKEDDNEVRIDMTGVNAMQLSMAGGDRKRKDEPVVDGLENKQKKLKKDEAADLQEDDAVELEDSMIHVSDVNELTRKDIMQMAFADDHVVEEFEEEKRLAQDEDAPKEVDLTLPGWGSWGGTGLAPPTKKVIAKPKPHEGVEINKRKDAKLQHVIINERRVKKAAKFMLPQLPYNFDNAQQYEHTLRMPIGGEWNAPSVHLSNIQPRITTKLGAVIKPPKLPKRKGGGVRKAVA